MKILLIEDDPDTAGYVANGLRENSHMVEHAANGRDGLFLASGGDHDMMVIDRMLPGLDGLSIVKTIRVAGMKAPVLMLTNLGGINDRVEGLEAGADDYLVKPFAFAELLARIMRNAGQLVTRTMLLENVWDFHFDPRTSVVETHISRLRAKVDRGFAVELIHTLRGSGYCIREPR